MPEFILELKTTKSEEVALPKVVLPPTSKFPLKTKSERVVEPVIDIVPALVIFPEVSTTKFVPPTVKLAPVTSSPFFAATFPLKVACELVPVTVRPVVKIAKELKRDCALTVKVSPALLPKVALPETVKSLATPKSSETPALRNSVFPETLKPLEPTLSGALEAVERPAENLP